MKTYYIPTSSLNFNNILSSESISPKAFYSSRSFGYSRWASIPENPFENSIVLYDQLYELKRPKSDFEDHPMIIEVAVDDTEETKLVRVSEHILLCDHTIYIDPFSSNIYFFNETDKRIALSMSDSSIETKMVHLYRSKIKVIETPQVQFPCIDSSQEMQSLNESQIEVDKKLNRMKGLLYGYYIGAILSASKEDVVKLNDAREIYDILAAILSSFEHKATESQRIRLKALYEKFYPMVPLFSKLSKLVEDKALLEKIVSIVRGEYGYIPGEFNVDKIISQLLATPAAPDVQNPVVEDINNIIRGIESSMRQNAHPVSVMDSQIVVIDGKLDSLNITELSDQDKKLSISWVNDVLTKDEFNGKISTFKESLSDEITKKAKELCDTEWKGSHLEITLNSLRRHVRGDEFPYEWNDGILSSMAAVVIRGDDWQKLLQYMQAKEMTDYRMAFAFYGSLNGFANLSRDFTDVLFSQVSTYIADVYKEFYGQLYGHDIPKPLSIPGSKEDSIPSSDEDMPDFENQPEQKPAPASTKECSSKENSCHTLDPETLNEEFESFMSAIVKKCSGAKKDRSKYCELFKTYGGVNDEFLNAISDEKVFGRKVQKGIIEAVSRLIKESKKQVAYSNGDGIVQPCLFHDAYQSTGHFLFDYDFLCNNSEFTNILSSIGEKEWKEDLKWFIDAHRPGQKGYYEGKPTDINTIISQFTRFKNFKYKAAETILRKIYHC